MRLWHRYDGWCAVVGTLTPIYTAALLFVCKLKEVN